MAEQLVKKDLYKIYQLMDFFVTKYNFCSVIIKPVTVENEIWLSNPDNKEFNLIRISITNLDKTYLDKQRIQAIVDTIGKNITSPKFLDVHVSIEQVGDVEAFDTLCIDSKYHSGKDVSYAFPGIYDVVHDVDNQEEEIQSRILKINESLKQRLKIKQIGKKINKLDAKIGTPITFAIIIICSIVEAIYYYVNLRFGQSTALYYLGADYYPFTILFGQFWRLLTYGFLHEGLFHLFINMYSIYILGSYFERNYGKLKYIIILLTGILVGGLTHDIMSKTTVSIGISAGIYTLFSIYIINALNNGAWRNSIFMLMIFINIMLNFMSGIAWQAHLGGAIVGFIYYLMFKDKKINYQMLALLLIMIILMIIKLLMG